MADPRTPIDDLARIAGNIVRLQDQIDKLKNPSGTSAFQAVSKLQGLIDDIQAQLDDYIANGTYNKAQLDAKFSTLPGPATVPGNLTLSSGGLFISPAAYTTVIGATRAAVWVDNLGRIGRT